MQNSRHNILFVMVILFLSVFPIKSQAAGRSADFKDGLYGYVKDEKGLPLPEADIGIFDGFTLERSKSDSNGAFRFPKPLVSSGRYAILYFANRGYIPQAVNIRMLEEGAVEKSVVMKRTTNNRSAFVIGAVYKPVRGGKIEFQSGIYSFIQERQVFLERAAQIMTTETDLDGHFLFEVAEGSYSLGMQGGREDIEIEVSEGETAIHNLRSGIILVD